MITKFRAFWRSRLNESGALPAIMAGAILISATAVLLAGFSVTMTRNAEMNSVKTNVNYYLNACEATLELETYKTFPSVFESTTKPAIKKSITTDKKCNGVVASGTTTPIVSVSLVGEPELYTPVGEVHPTSVKVVLRVDIAKGALKSNNYTEVVKYLDYADREDKVLDKNTSYIQSFDSNGNAVWVTVTVVPVP